MKYNIGDRIRFKNSKNSNEIYKVLEYNEEEGYKTRLERVGATVIIPNWQIKYTELVSEQVSEQVSKPEGKYKLIDILNKIANGELKEGTKVIYDEETYIFNDENELERELGFTLLDDIYMNNLSDEAELIEPECISNEGKTSEVTDNTTEKIEELKCGNTYSDITTRIIDKLNEVIRYINKGAEK